MKYELERWDFDERKWVILEISEQEGDINRFKNDPRLGSAGILVVTKKNFIKKVIKHYNYSNGQFIPCDRRYGHSPTKNNLYQIAALSHYHFIPFWVFYNKIPRVISKISIISIIPTIIGIIIYLISKNLPVTLSIWAALMSMLAIIISKEEGS